MHIHNFTESFWPGADFQPAKIQEEASEEVLKTLLRNSETFEELLHKWKELPGHRKYNDMELKFWWNEYWSRHHDEE